MSALANRWIFQAFDSSNGTELWITDGTAAGTQLLKNINTGAASSSPQFLASFGQGKLLFSALDGVNGRELWITDGTAAGTQLVKNINSGTASSSPQNFTDLGNGKALFTATDTGTGAELWITDGTAAGTQLLKELYPGVNGSSPQNFTALGNGQWLFTATDGSSGRELWITDGTADGTVQVKDIFAGSGASTPTEITAIGNGLALFKATSDVGGAELWITDGTAAGTVQVRDIIPGAEGSGPQSFTALGGGKWLFVAEDNANGTELWVTDGSSAGTLLVTNIFAGATGSFPLNLTALGNGKAVFTADNGANGVELWISDGTAAGTLLVKDIAPGSSGASIQFITALGGGKAVFRANDGSSGAELWVTDGTSAGTHLLTDIRAGAGSSSPQFITALGNGQALFRASDGGSGAELWVTDGTAAGTHLVKDIYPGASSSSPTGFAGIVVNHSPIFVGPPAALTPGLEDQAYLLTAAQLLQGYSDPDGHVLSVTGLTVDHGVLTDNGDGSWTYHPPTDYSGPVSFEYAVADGQGGSVPASLELVVEPVDDPAVIGGSLAGGLTEDASPNYVTGLLTVSDPDSPAGFQAVVVPALSDQGYGHFTLTADGLWTYVLDNANAAVDALDAGGHLVDTFSVRSADGTVRQISITITGYTDSPPTDIGWSSLDPGAGLPAPGAPMATLGTVDADSETFSYDLQAGSSSGFSITGSMVFPTVALATNQTYTLIVRSTDPSNRSHTETFTVITGTAAANALNGTAGDDVLYALGGNDTLTGGAGEDVAYGGDGADTFLASVGDGNDGYVGGAGTDTYSLANTTADATVDLAGGTATSAQTGSDTLTTIENATGGSGNDLLIGSSGAANRLAGGLGNDTYVVQDTTDIVVETAGQGTDTVFASVGYTLAANVENLTLTGIANLAGTGNALDNVITGNGGDNQLNGVGGVDVLIGGGGNDTYTTTLTAAGALQDTVVAGAGIDTLLVNGAVTLAAAATIVAGLDLEHISISGTGSTLLNVTGNELDNTLTGNGAANVLTGGLGNDTLVGGGGADRLLGGVGIDVLTGGNARDTFAFAAGDSSALGAAVDSITDLVKGTVGTGDLIDYTAVMTRGGSALAATATQASVNQWTGIASFAAGSGGTLADAVSDIAERFTAAGDAAGEFALFRVNGAGNYHLFISDGIAGAGVNDVVVELVGVTAVSQTSLAGGDLTILS